MDSECYYISRMKTLKRDDISKCLLIVVCNRLAGYLGKMKILKNMDHSNIFMGKIFNI